MTLWDRIVSLFRSALALQPLWPRVHGRVVWGDIDDLASPVPEALPPASELETPAPGVRRGEGARRRASRFRAPPGYR